jgi:hypothetical protein
MGIKIVGAMMVSLTRGVVVRAMAAVFLAERAVIARSGAGRVAQAARSAAAMPS